MYAVAHRRPAEAEVVEGRFGGYFRVDSEHGVLNGWLSPEVIYDVYVSASDGRAMQLWATRDTAFYRERGGALVRVSVADFGVGEKVRAHVGKFNDSGRWSTAYAVKVVALE